MFEAFTYYLVNFVDITHFLHSWETSGTVFVSTEDSSLSCNFLYNFDTNITVTNSKIFGFF